MDILTISLTYLSIARVLFLNLCCKKFIFHKFNPEAFWIILTDFAISPATYLAQLFWLYTTHSLFI